MSQPPAGPVRASPPPAGRTVRVSLAAVPAEEVAPLVVAPGDGRLERHDAVHAALHRPTSGHETQRAAASGRTSVLILPASRLDPSGVTRFEVVVDGWRVEVDVEDERRAALRERAGRGAASEGATRPAEVRAIIPGRVASVSVVVAQVVSLGEPLLVVEAMKMQNEVRAARAGTVTRVAVQVGQTLEAGDLMVVIE